MKIGYLMQHGPDIRHASSDGPSAHVLEVIHELRDLGHEVTILLGVDGEIWVSQRPPAFKKVAIDHSGRNPPRLFERGFRRIQSEFNLPYFNLFDSRRFARACRHHLAGVEVLFERMSWMGYGGVMASKQMNRPLFLEYNGDPLHDLQAKGIAPRGVQLLVNRRLMRATLRQASLVLASGNGWRQQSIVDWELPPDQVVTVENGTSLVGLLDRSQLRSFDDQIGGSGPVRLVYLGGFQPWQGVSILLDVFHRLHSEGLNLELVLIGSGSGHEQARQDVSERGLGDKVQMTGRLDPSQYAELLANADIGLSPYCNWSEFSGLKIYDYKAAGLAIIASGEAEEPAAIEHGRTGWVVPPCDDESLEDALRRLALDRALRTRLGRQARIEAERRHGWDHTARVLENLFIEVARETRQADPSFDIEMGVGTDG